MYLELKLSIEKVRAKKATENANYHLFWQVGVKKNKLRVVETGIKIYSRISPCVCMLPTGWVFSFFFFYPAFLVAFHSYTLLPMEIS